MLETAQKKELRTLVEDIKEILEKNYRKILKGYGISETSENLIPLSDLIEFELLQDELNKIKFQVKRDELHQAILNEVQTLGLEWKEGFIWYLDKIIYSFFNRLFAIRVLEELDLLEESTLVPQIDLGNRSARMTKIQERYPNSESSWWYLLLQNVFNELDQEIKVIFDPNDPSLNIYPDDDLIHQIVQKMNEINSEIYKAEDCIGWFYHYYVLKFRKGHKTMSAHGSKSPQNPYYLSILNTVYTPRWMIKILVDNSLGHWWLNHQEDSNLFMDSPYFINKVPNDIVLKTSNSKDLKILDPACGSGNFLVYIFKKLIEIYKEKYSDWKYSKIIKNILENNLYGIDINRRPAQLTALALYILAKRILKENEPQSLVSFSMPPVNILCCDIRLPKGEIQKRILNNLSSSHKETIQEVVSLFNNADQIGSLIDVKGLQKRILNQKRITMDKFIGEDFDIDVIDIVNEIDKVIENEKQNIGIQLFGKETKHALSLAQVLLKKYDIIVGNPPFGLAIKETKDQLKLYYPHSYDDLVSMFIDQSLRLLKKNGYLAMVTDFSFLHLPKFEKFRSNIFLTKSVIQYMILTGSGTLPNAGNRPILFINRNNNNYISQNGLYRHNSGESFSIERLKIDIRVLNKQYEKKIEHFSKNWNTIPQKLLLSLPRSVIDLTIEKKFEEILEFFENYPRLDFSQHSNEEKEKLKIKTQIARSYQGFATGNNDLFLRLWFEVPSFMIRRYEPIEDLSELGSYPKEPFIPYSKGGGDIQFYLSNGFILWWNRDVIKKLDEFNSVLRNLDLQGYSDIKWSLVDSRTRGRFTLSQERTISDVISMSIKIQIEELNKFSLLAYLNSKFITFFGRLQTKDRKWQAGTIARFPIPIDFLIQNKSLKKLGKESFELRREWDTGYPISPIFSESFIDKIISPNYTITKLGQPKTNHPFCEEYFKCKSNTANKIKNIVIKPEDATITNLLDTLNQRFEILINRLDKIDQEINQILDELLDENTSKALDDYSDQFIGLLHYHSKPDIWLKDFLMANIIDLIKNVPKGILTFRNIQLEQIGLYKQLIRRFCKKFDRSEEELQPILKELKDLLGRSLEDWIIDDFFFYHCHRFGGRPIIWQFTSKISSRVEATLNIFIDYHQLNENTLPTIRVDIIQPYINRFERQLETRSLLENEVYKIDELNNFLGAFLDLEKGYKEFPTPNLLLGDDKSPGKGSDKTWGWIFDQAKKTIENGYKPNLFLGVLNNLIPLCIDIPEKNVDKFDTKFRSIVPKGTINEILKKLSALDQLKQTSIN